MHRTRLKLQARNVKMGMRVAALGFPLGMGILRDVKGPAGQKRPVQFP